MIRENKEGNENNILRLNFEDIVLNYNSSLKVIKDFLDIDTKHIKKYKYFNPRKSEKNIGLWRKYHNQEDMQLIYSKLKQYCNQGI